MVWGSEEKGSLRFWSALAVLCVLFSFIFLGAVRWSREVVAERFVLVDGKGNRRAVLFSGPEGPVLTFLGENGRTRVALLSEGDLAGITFCDQHGVPRVGIALVENVAGIAFGDQEGILRMGIALTEKDPVISFYDSQGNLIRRLP
ncbi:MAG: hypothetical protein N2205_01880 [Candidatus Caldatribacterium sp.]|uniref:hypothetical protein n=1 Tax=Candidatus Caldatribacterium sp. TaxID=2282143 RepID=UPI00299B0E13|nr:hypothetical protein [Candidatus Caldatribacterium sp.]MCX7729954.1 hypothetical protein [Candidatus Caldatribacterium sp.]MDW8081138.1 hypothetical protein [Candidatus Calescibacterium sp.]